MRTPGCFLGFLGGRLRYRRAPCDQWSWSYQGFSLGIYWASTGHWLGSGLSNELQDVRIKVHMVFLILNTRRPVVQLYIWRHVLWSEIRIYLHAHLKVLCDTSCSLGNSEKGRLWMLDDECGIQTRLSLTNKSYGNHKNMTEKNGPCLGVLHWAHPSLCKDIWMFGEFFVSSWDRTKDHLCYLMFIDSFLTKSFVLPMNTCLMPHNFKLHQRLRLGQVAGWQQRLQRSKVH